MIQIIEVRRKIEPIKNTGKQI